MNAALQAITFNRVQKSERDEVANFLSDCFAGSYTHAQTLADIDLSFSEHLFAYHFFIGREKGKLVCAGALKHEGLGGDVWGIAWISVLPDKQKKGYGREMVEFLLQHFNSKILSSDQGTIILCCKEHLFPFYDRLKFNFVDIHGNRRLYFKIVERVANQNMRNT